MRLQPADELLVAHAHQGRLAADLDVLALPQVVDVRYPTAHLQDVEGLLEGVQVSPGDDHPVDALPFGGLHDLFNDPALAVIDDVGCAEFLGDFNALGPRSDGEQAARAENGRAGHGHQAHRTDSDDRYDITGFDAGELSPVKSGGDHVGEHRADLGGDPLRQVGQVAVGVVDMDQFGEDAVLDVGELPAAERNTGVHGVALLGGHRGPVGGDGGDDHLVANLEVLDHGSHFNDLTDRLVAEHHVVAFPTPPS